MSSANYGQRAPSVTLVPTGDHIRTVVWSFTSQDGVSGAGSRGPDDWISKGKSELHWRLPLIQLRAEPGIDVC